jgi:hypothetical protein
MSMTVRSTLARRAVGACLLLTVLAAFPASAQQATPSPVRAADVESIDAIIASLYESISGPVGQPRDWDRFRSLFLPGGLLVPTSPRADGDGFQHTLLTPDDYIERSGQFLVEIGFREHEIARVLERYGNIAHAFSTYEGFRGTETQPFLRGINSIQLWNDGRRWWILTVFWEAERPDNPLPERYLPDAR